jgi:hypothetical protein
MNAEPADPTIYERAVTIPKVFSFIEEPDLAMDAIKTFLTSARSNPRSIHIEQAGCKQIDLCAEAVLDALAIAAKRWRPVSYTGSYPRLQEALEIVLATGLPRALGLTNIPNEVPGFSTFPLTAGTPSRTSALRTSHYERVTTQLVQYMDGCYEKVGFRLSPFGLDRLGKLVGEVLANAEDHSRRQEWWVSAYLRRPGYVADCHIALFSFGDTLAESLQRLPDGSRLRSDIERLVAEHTQRGFFQPQRWTEEGLWTLYALQEGSTRHFEDDTGSRGVGTAEMIEAFQILGKTRGGVQPKMCVVSGQTQILFDERYPIEPAGGDGRRTITFNEEKSLLVPPDYRVVRKLRNFFPGTLIGLRFYLDPEHLNQIASQQ